MGAPDYALLAERLDRLEHENRLLKRAIAVILALCGIGLLLAQQARRGETPPRQKPAASAPAEPATDSPPG